MNRTSKIILCIFCIASFIFSVAAFSGAAAGSNPVISLAGDMILLTYSPPAGDELDYWLLEYSAQGSSSWSIIKNSSLDPNAELIIPQSLYLSGNRFRVVVGLASDGTELTSNVVTVPYSDDFDFTLSLDEVSGLISWTSPPASVTLHFVWYDNWSEIDPLDYDLPLLPDRSFDFWVHEYLLDLSGPYGFTNWINYTLGVYATVIYRGQTYTSNVVYRIGLDAAGTIPAATETYYDPSIPDVNQHVDLVFRAAKQTPVYYYVLSVVVALIPMITLAFILKKWT